MTTQNEGPNGPDFDALVETARKEQSEEAVRDLWQSTFDLEKWVFVARGEMPNVQPFIGVIEEKPYLMAFTDTERATQFANQHELTDDEGNSQTIEMPIAGTIQYVAQVAQQGVVGVLFNNGPHGYFASAHDLLRMVGAGDDDQPQAQA